MQLVRNNWNEQVQRHQTERNSYGEAEGRSHELRRSLTVASRRGGVRATCFFGACTAGAGFCATSGRAAANAAEAGGSSATAEGGSLEGGGGTKGPSRYTTIVAGGGL